MSRLRLSVNLCVAEIYRKVLQKGVAFLVRAGKVKRSCKVCFSVPPRVRVILYIERQMAARRKQRGQFPGFSRIASRTAGSIEWKAGGIRRLAESRRLSPQAWKPSAMPVAISDFHNGLKKCHCNDHKHYIWCYSKLIAHYMWCRYRVKRKAPSDRRQIFFQFFYCDFLRKFCIFLRFVGQMS